MKKNKLVIALLAIALLFTGCIPSEYTKGVDADEYPEKDMPVYDDATIFEYEADDEEVSITYGTEDKLDDVVEFYQDYFDDESIALDSENDEDDEYSAEGFFEDFLFEITVGEAKGKYEEKLFKTVVVVSVEFLSDEEIEQRQGGNLEKEILGFWEVVSLGYGGQDEDLTGLGFAMEFLAAGKMNMYMFYISEGMSDNQWSITSDGELQYFDPTMEEMVTAQVKIEKEGSDTFMYISENDGSYKLKKTDKDTFIASAEEFNNTDWFDNTDPDSDITAPTVDEKVILNQDGIVITMKGFETSYFSLDMNLLIENTTGKSINVSTDYIIVNGYTMQNAYIIGTVDPNAKLNTTLSFATDELALCNIDEIVNIELVFEVMDYDTWDTILTSDVVRINTGSSFVQTYDTSGTTLVDEKDVKIIYKDFVTDDEYYGPYVVLYIENNTDTAVSFSCDDTQINGFMVSGYIYATVQPGTGSVLKLSFYTSDLEENNIDVIESIKVSFQAMLPDVWEYMLETELIELPIN